MSFEGDIQAHRTAIDDILRSINASPDNPLDKAGLLTDQSVEIRVHGPDDGKAGRYRARR